MPPPSTIPFSLTVTTPFSSNNTNDFLTSTNNPTPSYAPQNNYNIFQQTATNQMEQDKMQNSSNNYGDYQDNNGFYHQEYDE